MTWNHWNALARATADYSQINLAYWRIGKFTINIAADGIAIIAYFANDMTLNDAGHSPELETLRQEIVQKGATELGTGLSSDGRTWCVLVKHMTERTNALESVACTTSISS